MSGGHCHSRKFKRPEWLFQILWTKKNQGRPFSLKERVSFPPRDPAKKRGTDSKTLQTGIRDLIRHLPVAFFTPSMAPLSSDFNASRDEGMHKTFRILPVTGSEYCTLIKDIFAYLPLFSFLPSKTGYFVPTLTKGECKLLVS